MNDDYMKNQLELLKSGEQSALPAVYSAFLSPSRDYITQVRARAIANFMRPLDGMGLIRLRESFSRYTSMEWYADWRKVSAVDIVNALENPDDCFYVLALGTFHPNGYFRQRCLEQLEPFGGKALPYALMLVNNWVEALREQALVISLRLLETASIEEIVTSLVCLERVFLGQRRSRNALSQLLNLVQKRLLESEGMTAQRIVMLDRYARRICYRLLLERLSESDQVFLLQQEQDSFGCLLIAKQLVQTNLSDQIWIALLENRSAAIRYVVVQARFRREGSWDGFEEYIFDSYQSLREYACYALRKHGADNLAEMYRKRIEVAPSPGAILGLGENGGREDVKQIHPFLEVDRPAYRKAALTAIANLTAGECGEFLYKHLRWNWSGKTAFRLIQRGKYRYPGRQCYEAYLACGDEVLRHRYFRLLLQSGNWEKLSWLIRLYPQLTDHRRETVTLHLERWQAGFTAPNQRQHQEIVNAMAEHTLSYRIANLLEFSLRTCGYFPEFK